MLSVVLDDVLVHSKTLEEHKAHLRQVFGILRKHKLFVKLDKCSFGVKSVDFFGHRISEEGVEMQKPLVDAILEWPNPYNIKEVQSFLGLANYYRRFIQGYARIAQPISDLLRTKASKWDDDQVEAFKKLKGALTSAPVLVHPSPTNRFVVSTDASKYAV